MVLHIYNLKGVSVHEKDFIFSEHMFIMFNFSCVWGNGEQKEPSKESKKSDKYEYEYYEVLNDGDEETPNVEIKYKDSKGKSHLEKQL